MSEAVSDAAGPSAWTSALVAIGKAGDRLADAMQSRGARVSRSEVYTSMLGALMDSYLNQIGVNADCPSFVPCTGYFQRLGSPNPDTVYRRAPVDPNGTYRLTGERGGARDVTLMAFTQMMSGARLYDLSQVASAPDGRFDVILSARKPEGHAGDWWELTSDTASLWLREVSDRWGEEAPARIAIVRLDPTSCRQSSPEEFDHQLAGLAVRVERIIEYGVRHVDELVADGYVNALKSVDYGAAGAMPLQFYHEGLFELGEGECLLVECRMPEDSRYFSWSLTDRMLVTLDWMNAQTSLNTAQASLDRDGVLRVIVSPNDPGAPNWMDTLGYRSGVMQFRTVGSPIAPEFAIKGLKLDEVFEHLPPGTARVGPDARLEGLRKRQAAWQMRRLW